MKNKNKYLFSSTVKIIILFFAIVFTFNSHQLYSQVEKEREYKILKDKLEAVNKTLDSLNSILKQKVDFINIEKSKPDVDKETIKELLSGTATLTNSIEKKQLEINKLTEKYNSVKEDLYLHYSTQIDSVNKSDIHKNEKISLTTKLIEKRLLVSPKIDILTFEPEKVIKIMHSQNPVEQKIYNEFLTSAHSEIEKKLTEIKELKNEIETILTLNEETSVFLEEAEFDNDVSHFNSNLKNNDGTFSQSSEGSYFSDKNISAENSLRTQTESFSNILAQLEFNELSSKQTYSLNNITEKKDIKEFQKLITQVEQQLIDYKTVVENKLKNF